MIRALFLCLVIASGGAYTQLGMGEYFFGAVAILSLLIAAYYGIHYISKEAMISSLVVILLFVLLMILRGEGFVNQLENRVVMKLVLVLLLIAVFSIHSYKENMFLLIEVFAFICKLGVIGWVIANVFPQLFSPVEFSGKFSNVNIYASYSDLTISQLFGVAFYRNAELGRFLFRNQGLFWEPGVFSFFICLIYVICNSYLHEKKYNLLFIVAELTTQSMGGLVLFAFMVTAIWSLETTNQKLGKRYLAVLLAFMGVAVIIAYSPAALQITLEAWGKIFGRDLYNDSSAFSRFNDGYYGLVASLDRLFLGQGWDYENFGRVLNVEAHGGKGMEWGGISNGIVSVLYRNGLFYALLYYWMLWRLSYRLADKRGVAFIFIGLAALLMHEPLDHSLLILLLLLYPPPEADASKPVVSKSI